MVQRNELTKWGPNKACKKNASSTRWKMFYKVSTRYETAQCAGGGWDDNDNEWQRADLTNWALKIRMVVEQDYREQQVRKTFTPEVFKQSKVAKLNCGERRVAEDRSARRADLPSGARRPSPLNPAPTFANSSLPSPAPLSAQHLP